MDLKDLKKCESPADAGCVLGGYLAPFAAYSSGKLNISFMAALGLVECSAEDSRCVIRFWWNNGDTDFAVYGKIGTLTRGVAIELLRVGKSLTLVSRDATGSCFTRQSVWLGNDGDLEMAHPIRDRGYVGVMDSQLAGLQIE